jgi:hypothetical protein
MDRLNLKISQDGIAGKNIKIGQILAFKMEVYGFPDIMKNLI